MESLKRHSATGTSTKSPSLNRLAATTSYHTNDDSFEEEEGVLITEEDVPSHMNLLLRETCSCRNKRIRRVSSKGAILVLVIACMVNISFFGALGDILSHFLKNTLEIREAGILTGLGIIFVRSIPQLLYPLMGWLADVHFGRFKVIRTSLWLLLIGYCLIFVTFLIKYFFETETGKYIVHAAIFPLSFLIINTGLAAFQANIIPFGLDQMPEASTEELSAFIHWYYGSRNIMAGITPLFACFVTNFNLTTMTISLCEVACIILALLLFYYLKHILIIEPKSVNPFKLVYSVLRFAAKHKVPLFRSAFTYWEDNIPARIDLGKKKYGGPFSNEEVEDVKTFIKTMGVLFVISVFMMSYYGILLVGIIISKKLDDTPSVGGICAAGEFYQILLDTIPIFIMIVIFETAIYPFFKACIPSMFRRIGLGMGVAIAGLLLLFIVDVFGYYKLRHTSNLDSNSTAFVENSCYLVNGTTEQQVDISVHIMPAPILLAALAETLVFISSLEFITAQSPYGMRGMLIGIFYCIRGVFGFITALLIISFAAGFKSYPLPSSSNFSCGLPLNTIIIVGAILGLIVFIRVARKHKYRERDEHINTRAFAENYYSYGHSNYQSTAVSQ